MDDYVARAVAAAADVGRLAALRSGLRQRMLASPLCDAPGFVRGLEDVYHDLWGRWLRSQEQGAVENGAAGGAAAEAAAAAQALGQQECH